MANLGENDYRMGAQERLADAQILQNQRHFAGAIYLAGRGVEGMLRAVVWKRDHEVRSGRKSLETGHDLRNLLQEIANLGLLQRNERDDLFKAHVQKIGRLWFNDMRFVSGQFVERRWRKIGVLRGPFDMRGAALEYYGWCVNVAKRCEVLCER
jgi:hypothetical protein